MYAYAPTFANRARFPCARFQPLLGGMWLGTLRMLSLWAFLMEISVPSALLHVLAWTSFFFFYITFIFLKITFLYSIGNINIHSQRYSNSTTWWPMVNYTCGKHSLKYKLNKSLCCTSEAHITLCINCNYTSMLIN